MQELLVAVNCIREPIGSTITSEMSDVTEFKTTLVIRFSQKIQNFIKMAKNLDSFKTLCGDDRLALIKYGCVENLCMRSLQYYDLTHEYWTIYANLILTDEERELIRRKVEQNRQNRLQNAIQSLDSTVNTNEPGNHFTHLLTAMDTIRDPMPPYDNMTQITSYWDMFRATTVKFESTIRNIIKFSKHLGVKGGSGPPLLLLHGHPYSHVSWRKVAERLALNFTVIASDLRGYGNSSAPPGGKNHEDYSKRVMAKDQVQLMEKLGYTKFALCAHDRGARVGHRMCIDYPDRVERAMFLDIAPTLAMYEGTTMQFAEMYWHWFFLIQDEPLPDGLIAANPDFWMDQILGTGGSDPERKLEYDSYRQTMRNPAYSHAVCEDYRASATIDLDHDRADRAAGRKIKCPVRVLWGANGVVGACFKPLDLWQKVADNVTGRAVPSGHDIQDEIPEVLLDEIYEFF
ncbi:unnamed protein product [Oppiella nova]|uniref:AB hydrolase-1 domain-containing protein n=1 Tax=Oppiella nova TaxID=334625 RepID=A0A7R9QB20_9ACAR|nr:unnamed protein product [Oppiella nova]CAG2162335.1 unnamed protein product [Oppiella nova]